MHTDKHIEGYRSTRLQCLRSCSHSDAFSTVCGQTVQTAYSGNANLFPQRGLEPLDLEGLRGYTRQEPLYCRLRGKRRHEVCPARPHSALRVVILQRLAQNLLPGIWRMMYENAVHLCRPQQSSVRHAST